MTLTAPGATGSPVPPAPLRGRSVSRRRVRRQVWAAGAIIVVAIGWVAVKGLSGSVVYYLTPSDIVLHHQASVGERIRLGGLVQAGTVRAAGHVVQFTVTDGTTHIRVFDTGGVPALFRPRQGVVVEGSLAASGVFRADTVLVKHSGVYRPPPKGQVPHTARLSGS